MKRKTSKEIVDGRLTEQQSSFCIAYVLLTEFNAFEAVEIAGYRFESGTPAEIKGAKTSQARSLLRNPKIKERIAALVDERDNQTVIDKFFVKNGLKTLAMTAENENTKVKAFELLGKELGMFVNRDELKITEDPGEIAKKALDRRLNLRIHSGKTQEKEDDDETAIC